jgi:hypothetical protein
LAHISCLQATRALSAGAVGGGSRSLAALAAGHAAGLRNASPAPAPPAVAAAAVAAAAVAAAAVAAAACQGRSLATRALSRRSRVMLIGHLLGGGEGKQPGALARLPATAWL